MRLVALLFSSYLTCLSCLPCADEVQRCVEQAQTSVGAASHSDCGRNLGDWCSPETLTVHNTPWQLVCNRLVRPRTYSRTLTSKNPLYITVKGVFCTRDGNTHIRSVP